MTTLAGLAWAGQKFSPDLEQDATILNAKWWHKWSIKPINPNPSLPPFVQHFSCHTYPFNRFGDLAQVDYFDQLDAYLGPQFNDYLVFLNEPDDWRQCQQRPSNGHRMYEAVIKHAPHAKIIGPQVSHADYYGASRRKFTGRQPNEEKPHIPNDWWWMRSFYRHCHKKGTPLPYGAAIHSYITHVPVANLVHSFLKMCREENYQPQELWITEFATNNPRHLKETVQFFRDHELITRYAYYGVRGPLDTPPDMMLFKNQKDFELSPVGEAWVSLHS